ncbi:MAG: phosphoribosyl-ATP diphosphatase [Bellilinea sp.]
MLAELFEIIISRRDTPRPGSYTNRLLDAGENKILKKINEETTEVIIAAKAEGNERLVSEAADLLYHLLVLLASRGLRLADVEAELRRRHQGDAGS